MGIAWILKWVREERERKHAEMSEACRRLEEGGTDSKQCGTSTNQLRVKFDEIKTAIYDIRGRMYLLERNQRVCKDLAETYDKRLCDIYVLIRELQDEVRKCNGSTNAQ